MASEQSDANVRETGSQEIRPYETSTSNTQPPRPSSLVMVMDPEQLGFFRLFTSVGVEITYGDLTFFATSDPLANIAVPRDLLQGIPDSYRAAEAKGEDDILIMDPSLGEEASPQPLAMIPPLSTSAIPTTSNSAPQTTEDSQADDDVESQGEDATAIKKSLL
ncbi:hypothetical protein LIER_23034 [Lithospermum erythrorhizon]|uniref:Uncharacterized protein n=1 Tax=Lithospermum erythrorhizon TaxID=34254 RepID=A0AAV3QW73_LITER